MKAKNLYICELGNVTVSWHSVRENNWLSMNTKIICRKSDGNYLCTYKDVLNDSEYPFWKDRLGNGIAVANIIPLPYPKIHISKRKIRKLFNAINKRSNKTEITNDENNQGNC